MLSKKKIVHSRGTDEDNSDVIKVNRGIPMLKKEVGIVQESSLCATQVEEFLLSEYFTKQEFLNLSCWDICSIHNTQRNSSNTVPDVSGGCRPITALALMFLSQYSSLPRSIKNR